MPKTSRISNDVYSTPLRLGDLVVPYLIKALDFIPFKFPITVYDPSVGDGKLFESICEQLNIFYSNAYNRGNICDSNQFIKPVSVDLDFIDKFGFSIENADSALESCWKHSLSVLSNDADRFNVVVTNPPYKHNVLSKFIKLGWEYSDILCYLLPITFLEQCRNRKQFLIQTSDNLQYIIPIHPRVKFRSDNKGTAQRTVAWFIWNKHFSYSKLGINSPFIFN